MRFGKEQHNSSFLSYIQTSFNQIPQAPYPTTQPTVIDLSVNLIHPPTYHNPNANPASSETRNEQKSRVGLAILAGLVKSCSFHTRNARPGSHHVLATGWAGLALLTVPRGSLLGAGFALLGGGVQGRFVLGALAFSVYEGVRTLGLALLGGVVPGVTELADLALEVDWVPLGGAGLAVVAGVKVGFICGTGALTGLLVECEIFRASDTFFVGEVPGGRLGASDAFTCAVVVVLSLAFALLAGGIPGGVGRASLALVSNAIPFSITGLTGVVGIKVRLILGAGALRTVLVESESFGASHALLVLGVPGCRGRAVGAFSGAVVEELALALALLGSGVEGLIVLAGDAVVGCVSVGLVGRADAVEGGFVPDFAVGAVGREGEGGNCVGGGGGLLRLGGGCGGLRRLSRRLRADRRAGQSGLRSS